MTYSLSEASRALSYGSRLEIPSIFALSRDPRAVMITSDLRIQDVKLESKSYAIFALKVLAHEEPFSQGPLTSWTLKTEVSFINHCPLVAWVSHAGIVKDD
jgi:hypothetical protein